METVRILLKGKDISDGRTVYKKTGTTPYVLRKKVRIGDTTVEAKEGSILLCHSNGNAYSQSDEIELIVEFENVYDLLDHLDVEY